ncbi:hypothetical protein RRG08_052353 [Elysia crispata]|uniref:Uncharacterized protein n=1 Tax=Elysia crispata TaxID=231223 RepID=A0AAE1DTG8_9GAST|nr:hypothetical protein RRG08_052353 [Elysia crispata]
MRTNLRPRTVKAWEDGALCLPLTPFLHYGDLVSTQFLKFSRSSKNWFVKLPCHGVEYYWLMPIKLPHPPQTTKK